ncbi:MAG TPA: polysaccharide deacetylase family protein [Candidatus Binataceae bacterium]|nr:polysaccharide deacetylase family protein [Candidatus Binataceae bacterium]
MFRSSVFETTRRLANRKLPILMYHGIAGGPCGPAQAYWSQRHVVGWDSFCNQVQLLGDEGWRALLPDELRIEHVARESRVLAITFDDGHTSDMFAAERLSHHGMRALFYLTWSHLGRAGYITKEQVGRLVRLGMSIGSHGLRHIAFDSLDDHELAHELQESKARLEDLSSLPVTSFACPLGAYDERVLAAAFAAGYTSVTTSDFRRAAVGGRAVFPRIPILNDTALADFRALLYAGTWGTARRRVTIGLVRRGGRICSYLARHTRIGG